MESIVSIDARDPDAAERVREAIESDLWLRRRDAIAEARRRVLERYQLFPYMAAHIRSFLAEPGSQPRAPQPILIRPDPRMPLRQRCRTVGATLLRRIGLLSKLDSARKRFHRSI
jgi:hypothetical protein